MAPPNLKPPQLGDWSESSCNHFFGESKKKINEADVWQELPHHAFLHMHFVQNSLVLGTHMVLGTIILIIWETINTPKDGNTRGTDHPCIDRVLTALRTFLWVPNDQYELFIHLKIKFRVSPCGNRCNVRPYEFDPKSPHFIQIWDGWTVRIDRLGPTTGSPMPIGTCRTVPLKTSCNYPI